MGNLTGVLVDGVERERNRYDDPRPHAVSSNLDGAFVYDARGRMTEGIDRSLVYTSFDLPREIITPAGVTHFDYDASGARVRKDGPAGTTVSIAGLYERRRTDAGTKHVLLVPGSDGLTVAQVIVDPARSGRDKRQVQYLHQDALGSVTLVTDERGNADASARAYYEPFGRRIQADGTPVAGPLADLRLGLTGHGHDDELGLIDLKGRIYDPVLKRVLTPDPLVSLPLVGQSYNRFSYALNDPINLVDPTGYQAGIGPDCGSCQLWVVPPIVDGGGIQSGQSGSGSTAWESVPQKIDWGEIQSLPSPPIRASSIDGTQSSAAVPYHGGFLGGLTYERQRAERLRYEADQQAALRGAVVGAGAALVIWSGGAALFAIEEITVLGGAIGTTATQVAATGALRTTTVVVPLLLGEYSIIEGLRRNDPGRIADGLMMAMSGGATFGTGLGSGPRAGGHLVGAAGGTTQAASQGFRSFSAFKRVMGPAGEGMQWHHIVQQTQGNVARFGSEAIHNTGNLVRLEIGVHRQVNGYYSSIQDFTGGQTVRRWLSTQSFEAQVEFGRGVLQRFGVTP